MSGSGGDNVASTSTSTAPASLSEEVHREIEALFNWNPRRLKSQAFSSNSTSKSTRPLAYYDKHFSEKMRLLHVKRLPSLVQQLQEKVDRALLAASATLPREWKPLAPAVTRDFMNDNAPIIAKDEKAVAEFYGRTTPPFVVPLASTIALHPKASKYTWKNLLLWTKSVSSLGYAIMDGELRIIPDNDDDNFDKIVETMDPETRRIVGEMRSSSMSLGTWEFKSLDTGSEDVMKAVHSFNDFDWTSCSEEGCDLLQLHQKQVEKAESTAIGRDAQNPPWTLGVCVHGSRNWWTFADFSIG